MAKKEEPKPLPNPNLPKNADTLLFDTLEKMLISALTEIQKLSNKNPNEIISLIKAESLNRICEPIKKILKKEPSADFLETFNTENMPSYSDVILMLDKYRSAMMHYRSLYYGLDDDGVRWFTKEKPGVDESYSKQYYKEYYQNNF